MIVLLPKFMLEKNDGHWQIWNTIDHEVVKTFETKQEAQLWLKRRS